MENDRYIVWERGTKLKYIIFQIYKITQVSKQTNKMNTQRFYEDVEGKDR